MSLLPFWLDHERPSRLLDQHFGVGLHPDELLASMMGVPAPRCRIARDYYRPWSSLARSTARHDGGSSVSADRDKFQVCLDVQQFSPEEITVKTVGNHIVVEGKHEEKQDEHGYVSRHFVRKYSLPEGHVAEDVVSSLSSDGVLSIVAPRKKLPVEGERVVPITATGPAHPPLPQKKAGDQEMQE